MSALDIERVRRALPGRRIDCYDSIGSTMTAAIGLPLGAAVVAEQQTSGQGRLGRSWHSEPGAGLYCTMVLAPSSVLTLALGLAARSAILEATGLCCDIRWPNDLMLGEKKVAGILVQVVDGRALAGIGINVNHREFPPELKSEATSLLQARLAGVGQTPTSARIVQDPQSPGAAEGFSREDILLALLRSADEFAALDRDSVLRLFTEASSYVRGRRVTVDQPGGQIRGVTAGLDEAGFLRLRTDDGADTLILAGGVRAAGS
jgi:BirA family biotin operon repressor/biotin-[acetyl-CoA-carboxylase] ligase